MTSFAVKWHHLLLIKRKNRRLELTLESRPQKNNSVNKLTEATSTTTSLSQSYTNDSTYIGIHEEETVKRI